MFAIIMPAMLGRRVGPAHVLRSGGRGSVGGIERRWGSWLIAAETALTVVLLVAGVLLTRSYGRLAETDLGCDRSRIARLAVTISPRDVPAGGPPAAYSLLQREIATVPGVQAVGLVYPTLPLWDGYRARFRTTVAELPHAPDGFEAGIHLADEGLLPMLEIPIIAGRNLRDADAAEPVAVVNRSVAMLLGGPDCALGYAPARFYAVLVGVSDRSGLALASLSARTMRSFVYGVGAFDPVTTVAVVGILLAVALAAASLPARRVASVDPAIVLRPK